MTFVQTSWQQYPYYTQVASAKLLAVIKQSLSGKVNFSMVPQGVIEAKDELTPQPYFVLVGKSS
jgi:hypothetical protein